MLELSPQNVFHPLSGATHWPVNDCNHQNRLRIGYPMLYFLKFKDLTCNFCTFSWFFYYFSVSFYQKKFRATGLPSRFGPEPVLGPWSFWSFSKKLRGPGLLVRLNRLQSGPVLGPIPVLQTGPWSTGVLIIYTRRCWSSVSLLTSCVLVDSCVIVYFSCHRWLIVYP